MYIYVYISVYIHIYIYIYVYNAAKCVEVIPSLQCLAGKWNMTLTIHSKTPANSLIYSLTNSLAHWQTLYCTHFSFRTHIHTFFHKQMFHRISKTGMCTHKKWQLTSQWPAPAAAWTLIRSTTMTGSVCDCP